MGKKKTDYLIFHTHYFNSLTAQHPKWETNQKNKVIALMWKKRRKNLKQLKLAAQKGQIHKTTKIKVG